MTVMMMLLGTGERFHGSAAGWSLIRLLQVNCLICLAEEEARLRAD